MSTACEHLEDPDWESIEGAVLIAGDAADAVFIAGICARLPWDAQGVVLLEAAARIQLRHIDVPDGVSVRWLMRGDGIRQHVKGERLAAAVHAWCVEWTCTEPPAQWTVWLGPHTPPRVARMARSLLGVAN
ncbi:MULTISPECIES: SIP domain-containing protein [unclassified Microbacterium]|uniref:SIP domain-containing protein n=1 Tax=unclassified Microbacterium TaxID=2609290 RepID=UPI001CBC2691|nr:SIP domain-containing protein [Microbacterium sp. OVT16B]